MSPFQILFLMLLLLPVAEIYLMIKVGGLIGAIPTIFLLVFAAVLGTLLLRLQGFATVRRVQESMMRGEAPGMAMLEGAALMIAGVLLLIPGFLTDIAGVLLLLPPVRRWVIRRLLRNAVVAGPGPARPRPQAESKSEPEPESRPRPRPGAPRNGGRIIEGEFERKE